MFTVEEADKAWLDAFECKNYFGSQAEHATSIAEEGVEIALMAWDDNARALGENAHRRQEARRLFDAFYRALHSDGDV